MFTEQLSSADGIFVVDVERCIRARIKMPYKPLPSDSNEIAYLIDITHSDWSLTTPIQGQYIDITRKSVEVAYDAWAVKEIHGPNARIELRFASQFGVISNLHNYGKGLQPATRDSLPDDISQIIAEAACALWKTQHFEMNSGWNAS